MNRYHKLLRILIHLAFETTGIFTRGFLYRCPEYLHAVFCIVVIRTIYLNQNIPKLGSALNVDLIVFRFNDTSTLLGHFVSSPREREKRASRKHAYIILTPLNPTFIQ